MTDTAQIVYNRFGLVAAVREWLALPDEVKADIVDEMLDEDETGAIAAEEFISILLAIGVGSDYAHDEPAASASESQADYPTGAYL